MQPSFSPNVSPRLAMVLEGNALAPRLMSGDLLTVGGSAQDARPGDVVLFYAGDTIDKPGAMILNGDGDLTDNRGGFLPAGTFTIFGIVVDVIRPEWIRAAAGAEQVLRIDLPYPGDDPRGSR